MFVSAGNAPGTFILRERTIPDVKPNWSRHALMVIPSSEIVELYNASWSFVEEL